jgi:hypothetical protein
VKVDVEVQRTAEALDQGDRAGPGRLVAMARFLDQMRGNDAVNDAQHLTHDLGPAGEQEAQGIRETEHPMAHGLFGQDVIDQQGRTFGHAPCPAAGTEAPSFTAKSDQVLGVAGVAAQTQEAMFETAAFEVILELPPDIRRQLPALLRQMGSECRVILVDDPIEKGVLGTMALVTTRIPLPGGRPGRRRVGHDPRPCYTVILYSLALSCRLLNPQPKYQSVPANSINSKLRSQ